MQFESSNASNFYFETKIIHPSASVLCIISSVKLSYHQPAALEELVVLEHCFW